MTTTEDEPRVFAARAEKPLAYIIVGLAVTTLVWKTVGLDFLPGWEDMFGGIGAQYPRRVESMAPAWALAYVLVYGVFGTAATVAGLLITRRRGPLESPTGPELTRFAKTYGLFHVILGAHHTAWALTKGAWGHLTLEQFEVPGLYIAGGLAGFGAGVHGLRLLLSSPTTPVRRVVRSKIALDGVTLLTFTSVLVCFPLNALGLQRNLELEKISWAVVFVGPVLWLLGELICSKGVSPRPDNQENHDGH